MTCPDWKLLVAERDASGDDPAGWRDALAHMDDCDACRRAALAADPTLVFRRLPSPPTVTGAEMEAEIDSMQRAVANLRHAQRVMSEADAAAESRPHRGADRLRRAAAAAVLAAAGLGTWFVGTSHDAPATPPAQGTPVVATVAPRGTAALPVFEDLSRPDQPDVYQVGEEDLTVVMVVDETLDI